MGREIKRVALDFEWPLGKTWKGYVNGRPDKAITCSQCNGTGMSEIAKTLHHKWYGQSAFEPFETGSTPYEPTTKEIVALATRNVGGYESFYDNLIFKEAKRLCELFNGQWSHHLDQDDVQALIDDDRLMDFTHRPRNQEQADALRASGSRWMDEPNGYIPTAREVNLWSLSGLGHDSINAWVCIRAKVKRLGFDADSINCSRCGGHGSYWESEEEKKFYEEWESFEPPSGEGWQLWETVGEGSPVSPVKESSIALATWLLENYHSSFIDKMSFEKWMAFIEVGWCPSVVGVGGKLLNGVEVASYDG